MLRLSLSPARAARWTTIVAGVEFLMRPATTADYRAAEAAAQERFKQALAGASTLADLGLPAPAPADLDDFHTSIGYTRELMAVELALRIVEDWRGLAVEDDEAPPITPRAMAAFLADPLRHNAFEAKAYARIAEVSAEGKGSPLPPNGSPAGAADTARAASKTASLARKGAKAATEPSAPSSKTGP